MTRPDTARDELLTRLFERVPVMITIYDPGAKTFRFNDEFRRVLGWTEEDAAAGDLMALAYPDADLRAAAGDYMASLEPGWREFPVTAKDGSVVPSAWANLRLSDHTLVGIGLDLRERKRADAALRHSEERYRTLFTTMTEGFALGEVVYGENGVAEDVRLLETNDAFERQTGLAGEAACGRPIRSVLPRIEQEWLDVSIAVALGAPARRFESYNADLERYFSVYCFSPAHGQFAVLFTDVTAQRMAEEELKRAERAVREEDRRKTEFIAILSHELRNPLAPIRFAVPILEREPLSADGTRAVQVIKRQLAQMARLVDDLLDASRISQGKLDLQRQCVTLDSIVTTAVDAVTPAMVAARHELEVVLPPEPLLVEADVARMTQVITNLLNNSARYTPRGGHIVLEARASQGRAVLRVVDDGIGIPEEALAGIFDMFHQVSRPEKPQGGLGVGLALSRRLVEMHGGTIQVRSAGAGQGAEFVVDLPLCVQADEAHEHASPSAGHQPLRVLIVDDNADLVEMLSVLVSSLGHEVRRALDGGTALAAARAYRPDVVLLDLGLPVLSGIEVAREIRRSPEISAARLIAITGWGQVEDQAITRDAGFDYHLTKPVDPDVLIDLLGSEVPPVWPRATAGL